MFKLKQKLQVNYNKNEKNLSRFSFLHSITTFDILSDFLLDLTCLLKCYWLSFLILHDSGTFSRSNSWRMTYAAFFIFYPADKKDKKAEERESQQNDEEEEEGGEDDDEKEGDDKETATRATTRSASRLEAERSLKSKSL